MWRCDARCGGSVAAWWRRGGGVWRSVAECGSVWGGAAACVRALLGSREGSRSAAKVASEGFSTRALITAAHEASAPMRA
eukprot:58472-Prymnesium_polylepis.1